MEIAKIIIAGIFFLALTCVSFQISLIFGILFFLTGLYAIIFQEAWERPGVAILWFMGGLICRVALSEILLPILKYETVIDVAIGLFAFGIVYLIGYGIKNS